MKLKTLILCLAAGIGMSAQTVKIDINMANRQEAEVNEPGYTPWPAKRVMRDAITVEGITITCYTLNEKNLSYGWSKTHTQAPYYMRLVSDGVSTEEESDGGIAFDFTGLKPGHHTIQTYNNSWDDPTRFEMEAFDAYINDTKVYSQVRPSARVTDLADATCLLFECNVASTSDVVTIKFIPTEGFPRQDESLTLWRHLYINALLIDVADISKQAATPVPVDNDYHADADSGSILLGWTPAEGAVSHTVYFGTDSVGVAESTTAIATVDTPQYKVDDLSSHNIYYWRVDETDASDNVTHGDVWQFRPRHRAFRTAEGYGQYAIGGRGGKVVYVTNLDASGPGSFRDAVLSDAEPKTIVFAVGGLIRLDARLIGSPRYLTVAGQTAPGKGVCFAGAPMGLGNDNVWRFVRMRLGQWGHTYDGIGMAGVDHSILDHASISWTIDEAFSSRNAKNITLQRTLISEALNCAGHQNYPAGTEHGYAGSVGGNTSSLHHNLLAHNEGRNWSLAGSMDGDAYFNGHQDIFNTVVYNWKKRTTDGGEHQLNFHGNYYKIGPASTMMYMLNAQYENIGNGTQQYWFHNNILANTDGSLVYDGTDDTKGRKYSLSNGAKDPEYQVWVDEPFFPSNATVESAADAYKSVLSDVGCTMPVLDDHDIRIINEVKTGTYAFKGSVTGLPGLPDSHEDVGGYEDYTTPAIDLDTFDTDRDGLPNWWEELYGTNPNSARGDFSDSNADPDGDGYTALEDYLEYMARRHYTVGDAAASAIDLSGYAYNYVAPVTFDIAADDQAVTGLQIAIDGATASIDRGTATPGVYLLTVRGTDSQGSQLTGYMAVRVDDNSGVTDVKADKAADNTVYNLQGVRVSAPIPGQIYICGGKKMLWR